MVANNNILFVYCKILDYILLLYSWYTTYEKYVKNYLMEIVGNKHLLNLKPNLYNQITCQN